LWQFSGSKYAAKIPSIPSVAGGLYLVLLTDARQDVLVALDVNTGEIAWSQRWSQYSPGYGINPVVTGSGVYVLNQMPDSDNVGIRVLDSRTGKASAPFGLNGVLENADKGIRSIEVYKSYLFLELDQSKLNLSAIK
jgi:outer membrane protein assembly factor BamB